MSDCSTQFDAFSDLPAPLQLEAIREGEERLRAQLEVATAADARALNVTAMLIAAIAASLGAGVAFLTRDAPDYMAALLGFALSALLGRAVATASGAIAPDVFHLPGNSPSHWLPGNWDTSGTERMVIERARREQAAELASAIAENGAQADERAKCVKESLRQVSEAIRIVAIVAFGLTLFRMAELNGAAG